MSLKVVKFKKFHHLFNFYAIFAVGEVFPKIISGQYMKFKRYAFQKSMDFGV